LEYTCGDDLAELNRRRDFCGQRRGQGLHAGEHFHHQQDGEIDRQEDQESADLEELSQGSHGRPPSSERPDQEMANVPAAPWQFLRTPVTRRSAVLPA